MVAPRQTEKEKTEFKYCELRDAITLVRIAREKFLSSVNTDGPAIDVNDPDYKPDSEFEELLDMLSELENEFGGQIRLLYQREGASIPDRLASILGCTPYGYDFKTTHTP